MIIRQTLLALLLAMPVLVSAQSADRYPWLTDLDEARELAAAERKPMLIVLRCEP